jgi:uncharacterized protein
MENQKGMCRSRCVVHWVAFVLVVIGALNWGLVAFGFNLVDAALGAGSTLSMIVYILVGIAGIAMIFECKCKHCSCTCEVPPVKPQA